MATLKELRNRVTSLKSTIKITSAMKMVSASKLRRAKDASQKSRPYMEKMEETLHRVVSSVENFQHPLIEHRDVQKTRCIIITSDRGLCGGFNNNLVKYFLGNFQTQTNTDMHVIGKRAFDSLTKKSNGEIKYYDGYSARPKFEYAQEIAKNAIDDFKNKKIDKVVLIYNQFISTLTQKPSQVTLLPISTDFGEKSQQIQKTDYIFEPNPQELLNVLLPKKISIQVFQAMLDNAAGEHAARMTAMDNATNNAKDLINSLTIQMNRARQAAITTELTEIVSGAESLKN